MMSAPRGRSSMLALSAAGFIATSTSGASPGVREGEQEAGYRRQGARRSAYLGGEVRQGGQVVAERRRLLGEPVAGQLHAVARVPGEPDDDTITLLDLFGHSGRTSSTRRGRAT